MDIIDMFGLSNKVAIVTGAGRGIGRAIALGLAGAGADIVISDMDDKTKDHVCGEVADLGRKALFIKADLTRSEAADEMISLAASEMGGPDIAVNAAALYSENWEDAMNSCLNSVYYCCMAEASAMKKKNMGKIINIASISGISANVGTPYCVAKAGVIMLTKCLAKELGTNNINVNSISPTYTLSTARRFDDEEMKRRIRASSPMGWYMRPDDIVGTAVYLASGASDYLTGQNIIVDGGHLLSDWFTPLPEREADPLISPSDETRPLIHDLDMLGIGYNEYFVALK